MILKCGFHVLGVVAMVLTALPNRSTAYRYCPIGWYYSYWACFKYNPQPLGWQQALDACSQMAPGATLAYFRGGDPIYFQPNGVAAVWIGYYWNSTTAHFVTPEGYYFQYWSSINSLGTAPHQGCVYYDLNTLVYYSMANCSRPFPSFCMFDTWPGQEDVSLRWNNVQLWLPLTRLYGSRDISRENDPGKSIGFSLVTTGVMTNVAMANGQNNWPGAAVKFQPSLAGSGIFFKDSAFYENLSPTGSQFWLSFTILPTLRQNGTILSYLWSNGDGKGLNIAYDGNTSLIFDIRRISGANAIPAVYTAANCVIPDVWQRIIMVYDSYFYVINMLKPNINCFGGVQPGISIGSMATTKGLVLGQNPSTGAVWNGSLSCVMLAHDIAFAWEIMYEIQMACNGVTSEIYVDVDIPRRLPMSIPGEQNLIGFWPLSDYYGGREGSGKIFDFSYSAGITTSTLGYANNFWLKRNIYSGNGKQPGPIIGGTRDNGPLSLYRSSFAIVFHIYKFSMGNSVQDTTGPLLEYQGNNGSPVPGLTLWMLANGTLAIVSAPSVVNNQTQLFATFPNCYPSNLSQSLGRSTYRITVLYNYTTGVLLVQAARTICGNITIGQRDFDTMKGFQIGASVLTSPFQLTGFSNVLRSFLSGQLFCLFIYDTTTYMTDFTNQDVLSMICNSTSAATPLYGGQNNLLYKPSNLRVFLPLGRDLGATDISGRNHHGEAYRMASAVGPTSLPYSASHFWGTHWTVASGDITPYFITLVRPEYYMTLGSNNSITYALWLFVNTNADGAIGSYDEAVFVHGDVSASPYGWGITGVTTGLWVTDAYTLQFRVMLGTSTVWTMNLPSPSVITNRWLWIIVQYNRVKNFMYFSVNDVSKKVSVSNVQVMTTGWLSLGAGNYIGGGDKRLIGKMSCFMMYDYAVANEELMELKSMCSSTLDYFYGQCEKHFRINPLGEPSSSCQMPVVIQSCKKDRPNKAD